MKNNSIMLDQLIETVLLEQTGLVHDPVNKTDANANDTGTADSKLDDMIFWGSVIIMVAGSWIGQKFLRGRLRNYIAGKLGSVQYKRLPTKTLLKLWRGMGNPANVNKFKKWCIDNTNFKVILEKGSTLESLAKKHKSTSDAIWEANKDGAFKGMRYSDVGKQRIVNVMIPRVMTKAERDRIFLLFENPQTIRLIRRDLFKESFKRFKQGQVTANEFIKELTPAAAKKHGPRLRAFETNRRRGGNVTVTYTPPEQ